MQGPRASHSIYLFDLRDRNFVDADKILMEEKRSTIYFTGKLHVAVLYNTRSYCLSKDFNTSSNGVNPIIGKYIRYNVEAHVYYDIRSNRIPIY